MKSAKAIAYCVDQILKRKKQPLLVGVVGDSGSGKSYFSDKIQAELRRRGVTVSYVNHDEFLIPRADREPLKAKAYATGILTTHTPGELHQADMLINHYEDLELDS